MRLAYNLSYATGYTFLNAAPEFVASDEIQFRKSVPVGSILTLTSKVCYSPGSHKLTSAKPEADGDPTTFQIAVQAHTIIPGLNEQGLTNTFRFTFRTPDPQTKPVPHLLARSYAEFIEYLDARRRIADQSA
ncbi:hypothetical protein DSO57_1039130 [Entomophthora muscae]|uniref:Uncharacterized protein n=1 Tax=Entomophthora muscae TaxID=34485 RepID=A0ACC2SMT3_9FUNG|nr:hypothetical protein DSO57_1039130 [Entomophthora muscae]